MAALISLFENYQTDSEDEGEEKVVITSRKRKSSDDDSGQSHKCPLTSKVLEPAKSVLPVPDKILTMFNKDSALHIDDSSQHEGRIRAIAHQAGNWASFVFIPLFPSDDLLDLCSTLISSVNGLDLHPTDDLHISLSRTLILRHHQIDVFVDSLKSHLNNLKQFFVIFDSVEVYTNEDKTRTFLGLTANQRCTNLNKAVDLVDETLEEFNMQKFYLNPSFHASFGWCLSDRTETIEEQMASLQAVFAKTLIEYPKCRRVPVQTISFKTGNKEFSVKLKPAS